MNIFDILGPVMVGPSSSHTAGAVRIGLITKKLLGSVPVKADITLSGSFAATSVGHGTDKALVAGLLGMDTDNIRIPESFQLAGEQKMEFTFSKMNIRDAHPNTARIMMEADNGKKLEIQAYSIGGGRIRVSMLDGMDVNFSGETHTLIVRNQDQPGCITDVSTVLNLCGINIATMQVFRARRGGSAVMVVETDQVVPESAIEMLERRQGILKVTFLAAI